MQGAAAVQVKKPGALTLMSEVMAVEETIPPAPVNDSFPPEVKLMCPFVPAVTVNGAVGDPANEEIETTELPWIDVVSDMLDLGEHAVRLGMYRHGLSSRLDSPGFEILRTLRGLVGRRLVGCNGL